MEIIIQPTSESATAFSARIVGQLIRKKPDVVLGLTIGSTLRLLYRELIEMKLDWGNVTTFNLEEYVGLSPTHPQSYHTFMWENLFRHVNINKKNVHIPDGHSKDVASSCAKYESVIRSAGGIDLQVLGIGSDGHIGFNEPTSFFGSRTRSVALSPQSRKDNAGFFGNVAEVPHRCITMGIGTIMEARQNLLLAIGKDKARAIAEASEGPVSSVTPASVLQTHPMTTVCLDQAAAADLHCKGYSGKMSKERRAS